PSTAGGRVPRPPPPHQLISQPWTSILPLMISALAGSAMPNTRPTAATHILRCMRRFLSPSPYPLPHPGGEGEGIRSNAYGCQLGTMVLLQLTLHVANSCQIVC